MLADMSLFPLGKVLTHWFSKNRMSGWAATSPCGFSMVFGSELVATHSFFKERISE